MVPIDGRRSRVIGSERKGDIVVVSQQQPIQIRRTAFDVLLRHKRIFNAHLCRG